MVLGHRSSTACKSPWTSVLFRAHRETKGSLAYTLQGVSCLPYSISYLLFISQPLQQSIIKQAAADESKWPREPGHVDGRNADVSHVFAWVAILKSPSNRHLLGVLCIPYNVKPQGGIKLKLLSLKGSFSCSLIYPIQCSGPQFAFELLTPRAAMAHSFPYTIWNKQSQNWMREMSQGGKTLLNARPSFKIFTL